MRLRLNESAITSASCFREKRGRATLDFCDTIHTKADIAGSLRSGADRLLQTRAAQLANLKNTIVRQRQF